jgi:hypothetical protein
MRLTPCQVVVFTYIMTSHTVTGERLIHEKRGGGVAERVLRISPGEFEMSQLEARCRTFLRQTMSSNRFVRLTIDVEGRNNCLAEGRGGAEISLAQWLDLYLRYFRRKCPRVEAIAFEGSAVMRYQDLHGRTGRVVLVGHDPLLLKVDGIDLEILHARASGVPRVYLRQRWEPYQLHFSLRTSERLSSDLGRKATIRLQQAVRLSYLSVDIRNDKLFALAWSFPVAYPFESAEPPPPLEQLQRSEHVTCVFQPGTESCGLQPPRRQ